MHPAEHHVEFASAFSLTSRQYRQARLLNPTLLDLCQTNLEERLYSQGFDLLSSALTSGTGSSVPAQLPPPHYLAFAATLVVHPQLTSRTTSSDKHAAADDAWRYLRQVSRIVGPRNASLDNAFRFNADAASSRGQRARSRWSDIAGTFENVDDGSLDSSYARQASLWNKADDFWSVVGWAFNCSVAYLHRWARWKLLLDLLLEVLENDLAERLPAAREAYEAGGTAAVQTSLKDCMFTQYLSPIGEGRSSKRRLMRAIFADGSQKSLAEFGEIWKHETKPPKPDQQQPLSKRRKLDLENGEFGDYLDESDEDSPGSSVRRSRSVTAVPSAQRSHAATDVEDESGKESNGTKTPNDSVAPSDIEVFGDIDSIRLRRRILALLTHYCALNPDEFLDNEDLFDLYTEFIRPLPLPLFQQFAVPSKLYLEPKRQGSLNQMLLRPLLAATAPPYRESVLTQDDFVVYYAAHAANNTSAVDNAKVGLLVEYLLRLLWNKGDLQATEQLRGVVEQGIAARAGKVAFDGRRKVGMRAKVDEDAVTALKCSAERMMMMLA